MRFSKRIALLSVAVYLTSNNIHVAAGQQDRVPDNPAVLTRVGDRVIKVNDAIRMVLGFGNTFMVTTPDGNVIIDTSIAAHARVHHRLLRSESSAPTRYIILTHAHGDHTGGVPLWKEPGTQIIAQRNHVEFAHYQARLGEFFARRNAAQFGAGIARPVPPAVGNYGGGRIEPTVLFDDKHEFTLGGVKFEVYRTPGETADHVTVWIPQYRVAFSGDNYYESFPNIYTLRGTPPRWALDYVNSLNFILGLKPEIVLPSHGGPIIGNADITTRLTRYRDAILYVHDETVKGMNAGKDVYTLMREIKLPAALDVGESYGKLSWSVRGIYEGYIGWFDLNPATMYETPASAVYPALVKLAGGPDAVVKLANERVNAGQPVEALRLTDVVLEGEAGNKAALETRLKALEILVSRCKNTNERGWLDHSIRTTKAKLSERR
jgi:alkyl sulfatase BDS1-like metallo-beta-lactamase superfamily hydrolase